MQKKAVLIIYSSPNGRAPWRPVLPENVPAWVIEPDNLGRLVAGEMCCDAAEGDIGSLWYRATEVATPRPQVIQ